MAWRFGESKWVREGTLDNTISGKITGEIRFASIGNVKFDLVGNMQGKFAGRKVEFSNPDYYPRYLNGESARSYMRSFGKLQSGKSGDIYCNGDGGLYIEWFSEKNSRCVIEMAGKDPITNKKSYLIEPKKKKTSSKK